MNKKIVVMIMPHMVGGGAERVAAQIMNKLNERGYDTRFVLTRARKQDVVRTDLNEKTELILLTEELKKETAAQKVLHLPARAYSTILGKLYEKQDKYVPASVGKATIEWQYHREIAWLRSYMKQNPDMTVIVFLQPSIPMVLLAAQGLPNKVIISERGNPNNIFKKRYGWGFMKKYYPSAHKIVFQTKFAQERFPKVVAEKGVVIKNPLKEGLPEPYIGSRNHDITTFCRIHPDKDLMTLLKAFHRLYKEYPDYKLKIIGDAKTANEVQCKQELMEYIDKNKLENAVVFQPFSSNVHREIIRDAMYVNSSVTEGLCNAMLEAMAIGMPVVCTDCPIGGARDTIENEVNGLLVPVRDDKALYLAMKKVIEDEPLSNSISNNAASICTQLSLDRIVDQWEQAMQ